MISPCVDLADRAAVGSQVKGELKEAAVESMLYGNPTAIDERER